MSGTVMRSIDGFTQRVKLLVGKDGWPIALGEWRYGEDGKRWHIVGIGERYVWGEREGGKGQKRLRPEWLAHEEPDSWERVERDAVEIDATQEGFFRGVARTAAIVARCKRLAGVGE